MALLRRCKPAVYMEMHEEHMEENIGTIEELGYACYWRVVPMFNPANWKGYPLNFDRERDADG